MTMKDDVRRNVTGIVAAFSNSGLDARAAWLMIWNGGENSVDRIGFIFKCLRGRVLVNE